MHQSSGRWQLGLILTLLTAFMWGLLPLALKGVLTKVDAYTITFYRFLFAALVSGAWLFYRNNLPKIEQVRTRGNLILLLIASLGLILNYIAYLLGLDLTTPSAAQVVIQLAPMLLLISGLVVFKESFSPRQWLGLGLFVLGLMLFFNQRLSEFSSQDERYWWGVILVIIAAVCWALYAIAQKQLLKVMSSQQIMLLIYVFGAAAFWPFTEHSALGSFQTIDWLLLAFCCANTLIAYGAFAEALDHWEASRVSATLAITPLLTMLFAMLSLMIWPGAFAVEPLNIISWMGAGLLVLGSALTALSKR